MFSGSLKEAVKRDPLVRLFQRLTKAPDPAEWNFKQGRKYLDFRNKKFNYSLGVAHLKEALKLIPHSPLFHANLGEALLSAPSMAVFRGAKADFALCRAAELALPELQKAIRLAPDFAWPFYLLAVCHEYLGQPQKSVAVVRQALGQNMPKDAAGMFAQYLEALEAAAARPADKEKLRQLEEECLKHVREALRLRDSGKYKQAQHELEQAGKVSPGAVWLYGTLCKLGEA
jgi:tetratricopeptide (TPR) repeat protein